MHKRIHSMKRYLNNWANTLKWKLPYSLLSAAEQLMMIEQLIDAFDGRDGFSIMINRQVFVGNHYYCFERIPIFVFSNIGGLWRTHKAIEIDSRVPDSIINKWSVYRRPFPRIGSGAASKLTLKYWAYKKSLVFYVPLSRDKKEFFVYERARLPHLVLTLTPPLWCIQTIHLPSLPYHIWQGFSFRFDQAHKWPHCTPQNMPGYVD